jgi:hypothetical protein
LEETWLGFEEIEKTGKGPANDRNSATKGHVSAYFLTTNDTVFSFVALILFFS